MTVWVRAVLALTAAAGCLWAWFAAQSVVPVAPVAEGEPTTASVVYDPAMLALALLLAAVAGVLAVLAVAGCRRPAALPIYTP